MSEEKPKFRWSFSQWSTYNVCPAKWKFSRTLPRRPTPPAAARGLEIHKTVEDYIAGHGTLHPAISPKYIPIIDQFRNHPNGDRHTEYKVAFDSEWYLCSPGSQHTAVLAVLDAVRYLKPHSTDTGVLHIGEWKSGKPKDDHGDQRKLYAMFGMKAWLADEVHVTTYYLEDTAPPQRLTLKSQEGFEKLKALWNERIDSMKRDEICAPRPGWHCKWCEWKNEGGGPCRF